MILNGQGPDNKSLLLIGDGRIARHFSFYLGLLNIPFETWNRRAGTKIGEVLPRAGRVLLAIKDDALAGFIDGELAGFDGPIVHFSGAFDHPRAIGAHPLMSFGPELYPADFYPRIHFSVTGASSLGDALPGWPNGFTILDRDDKALYHALCVIGGNFPVLLWNKMENGLKELGLPEAAVRLYVERVAENYRRLGAQALTGPLIRKDEKTIERNLASLEGDPWRKVYEAFREAVK